VPIGDWDDPATWDQYYTLLPRRITKPATETDITMHYCRCGLYHTFVALADKVESALGWTPPGGTVLIYGCAYGWMIEALEAKGYTRVVGADPSGYIQGRHDQTEEADVDAAITAAGMDPATGRGALHKAGLYGDDPGPRGRSSRGVKDEEGITVGSRNRLKSAVGLGSQDDFDWVLSENLIESLTDAEIAQVLPHYDAIGLNSVHIISVTDPSKPVDPGNWKTTAQWRAFLDGLGFTAHQFIVKQTGEVF
jgi:hypothetical protein